MYGYARHDTHLCRQTGFHFYHEVCVQRLLWLLMRPHAGPLSVFFYHWLTPWFTPLFICTCRRFCYELLINLVCFFYIYLLQCSFLHYFQLKRNKMLEWYDKDSHYVDFDLSTICCPLLDVEAHGNRLGHKVAPATCATAALCCCIFIIYLVAAFLSASLSSAVCLL